MSEQVQINKAHILAALEHDAEFFIQFFLEDELTFPVPEFHKDIFYLMTLREVTRFVCAIPRDHAKTTLAKLAAVWYFLFTDYRFIVYMSNTATIAVPATNDIVNFLESDNFKLTFGPVEWIKKQDGVGFYIFKIGDKTCILRAMGAGQQVRGINVDNKRPQLAILDDIEDNDNIATEPLFRKLKQWFYGPFRKALDKFHNKIIHLGNMINVKSLLNEHCNSEFWHSRRYGCILANGKPLWPDAWTLDKLKRDFVEYSLAGMSDIWFAEMMNLPLARGKGLIKAEDIFYAPACLPGDIEYGFLTLDLAISEKAWAHQTVLVVHGWTGAFWQIVEYEMYTGIDPVTLFTHVKAMMTKWHVRVCGIEDEAYQASLKFVFRHLTLMDGMDETQMMFVPLSTGKKQKVLRLAPWAGLIKAGQYALTEGEFMMTQQLLMYDPLKKNNDDDAIDAAAYGPQMTAAYLDEIIKEIMPIESSPAQTLYEISAI